TKCVVM
nr:Chain G, Hexapeptide TKCVVM [synthetic construct]